MQLMGNIVQKAIFNSGLIPAYGKLADLSAMKHKLIASNVANANTSGYQKKEIDFDKELKKAIAKPRIASNITDPRHIPLGNTPGGPPKITQIKHNPNSAGDSTVDIEEEMADLAQNQIIFDYGAEMLARQFKGLKAAIRGRE
jgi:flagellar basal-body rod protein FlgB